LHGGDEQRASVFVGEPFEREARQGRKQLLVAGLPDREQEEHRICQ
jgi:hypothetical protein